MSTVLKFIVLSLCVLISSCVHEGPDGYGKPIALKYSNVDFEVRAEGCVLRTTIPYAEKTISISPEYEGPYLPKINNVTVNGTTYYAHPPYDEDYVEENPVLQGDWGDISYDYSQADYTIHIKVNDNNSSSDRKIKILITETTNLVYIDIIQEANPDISD